MRQSTDYFPSCCVWHGRTCCCDSSYSSYFYLGRLQANGRLGVSGRHREKHCGGTSL